MQNGCRSSFTGQSHPARGAWIEIDAPGFCGFPTASSHPARGAWIEIASSIQPNGDRQVAPRKGGVD